MEQKKWYGIGAVCLIVVCIVVIAIVSPKKGGVGTPVPPQGLPTVPNEPAEPTLEKEGYVSDVPSNAVVSVPVTEAPAAPNVTEKFRSYEISITKEGYSPSSITVNKGDVIQLSLTAVDGAYDFSMPYTGLSQTFAKGERKQVSFGATSAGTFEFRCDAACPPGKIIRGQLIVLP
jgi:heme/copper-type cytochrome/quinol oxidase subunit 2